MKTLITLNVLQTIGIVALVVHAFGSGTDVQPARQSSELSSRISSPHTHDRPDDAALLADEKRWRAVLREELAQLQAQRPQAPHAAAPPSRDEADDRRRQVLVAQQLEAYKAMGSITDQQMQELQADMAQLDPASRKQMMMQLVRALNSGELKGRL